MILASVPEAMNMSYASYWTSSFKGPSFIGRSAEADLRSNMRAQLARATILSSVGMSMLLCGLITLFAALGLNGGYRNVYALSYVVAYAAVAYFTWRASRFGAIGALVLYVFMNHSKCGYLHLTIHMMVLSTYAAGIWGTVLIHRLPPNDGISSLSGSKAV
jgi:hypothetical protein